MDVLRTIVHEVNGRLEVFMDGGIRSGADVFKALAYGMCPNLNNLEKFKYLLAYNFTGRT